MEERKCYACGGFRHIAYSCRNVEEKGPAQVPSNKFEVLRSRVMQKGEGGGGEVRKYRKEILKEQRAKRGVEVRQTKVKKKGEKGETVKRSDSEDWVKTEGRKRENCGRCVVR